MLLELIRGDKIYSIDFYDEKYVYKTFSDIGREDPRSATYHEIIIY